MNPGAASSATSIHFADLTSPLAGALLRGARTTVLLLPVGAVEPHGPHAPLGTDSIISTEICERAATQLLGDDHVRALVLPSLPYGVTRYGAAFPGAVTISERTLSDLVVDVCSSLHEQGFHRVVIVNSHFEPEHVAVLRAAATAVRAGFLDLTRRRLAQQLTDEFRTGAAHAGRYETSLVLATRPDLVDTEQSAQLPALPVDMPEAIAAGRTDFVAMGMTEAYCGAPAEASAAEGDATLSVLTALLIDLVREQAVEDRS